MKAKILFLVKLCISAVLAVVILSGFCLIYYNPPVAVAQPDRYTNHRFESNSFWSNMTEGAGWGKINNIGYSNHSDYETGRPTIAFIGSSQVEAQQIPQAQNFVSVTHDLLLSDADSNNDFQCVNLGVSGHFFNISASNFEYFAEHYEGIDYAVLEVSSIGYTDEQFDKILSGDYHSDLEERNTLYRIFQKIPYFRLLFKQLQDLAGGAPPAKGAPAEARNYDTYQQGMNAVIKKISDIAKNHDIQLIILYHHPLKLNADKTAQTGNDPQLENILATCCQNNGVPFINMNQAMIDHFEKTYEPSYGFANTKPGEGHLNTVGHHLIAQEIYAKICALTEGK